MSDAKGLAADMFALCGIQFEASVVKSSLDASMEGLCGLVGPTVCPIAEEESCQVQGAADGFSLCSSLRDGSVEPEGEEEWA